MLDSCQRIPLLAMEQLGARQNETSNANTRSRSLNSADDLSHRPLHNNLLGVGRQDGRAKDRRSLRIERLRRKGSSGAIGVTISNRETRTRFTADGEHSPSGWELNPTRGR